MFLQILLYSALYSQEVHLYGLHQQVLQPSGFQACFTDGWHLQEIREMEERGQALYAQGSLSAKSLWVSCVLSKSPQLLSGGPLHNHSPRGSLTTHSPCPFRTEGGTSTIPCSFPTSSSHLYKQSFCPIKVCHLFPAGTMTDTGDFTLFQVLYLNEGFIIIFILQGFKFP